MNKVNFLILSFFSLFLITGCSEKKPIPKRVMQEELFPKIKKYKKNNYLVLRQNNLSQRAVVDMGVVLKTTITSYKDAQGNLIASHDVFFWGKKPDFITTNTLPNFKEKKIYKSISIGFKDKNIIDLNKSIVQEQIRRKNNFENDKKILEFLKKEMAVEE